MLYRIQINNLKKSNYRNVSKSFKSFFDSLSIFENRLNVSFKLPFSFIILLLAEISIKYFKNLSIIVLENNTSEIGICLDGYAPKNKWMQINSSHRSY